MYDRLLVRFDHLYCCERCYSSLIINGCESADDFIAKYIKVLSLKLQ